MKKVLTIFLAFAVVFSMAGVVSAEDTQDISGTSGDTEVTYTTQQSYTVTIPTKVAFSELNLKSENSVKATNVLIPDGALLEVTISSGDDGFNLVYGSGLTNSKIPYNVTRYDGKTVDENINIVLQVASNVKQNEKSLVFWTTEENVKKATMSGEHKDILTFSVSVKESPSIDEGEPETIYIGDYETLLAFAKDVDNGNDYEGDTIILTSNIDLTKYDSNGEPICFDPIGSYRYDKPFKGTFDGNGNTISGLSQNTWALDNGYYYSDCGLGLFGAVQDATIKNLNIDGASISGESALCGVVAAVSAGETTFENIKISNANCADYQYYAGGIVGWASGKQTFVNCHVDSSNKIAAQWGDFDNSIGGVIGGASISAEIHMKDCIVECRIDAYNDVTSTYQWYSYRRAGMLIGNSGATETVDGTKYASAPQLTCENVEVIYGDWANYHYCEFAGTSWPYVRREEGVSNSAYSNPRYGHPTDANGNEVVDDNHVHNEGEDHLILCVFDQLYGGGQRVYGTATHSGVNVVYNNK